MAKWKRLEDLTPAEAERAAPLVEAARRNGLVGTHVILGPSATAGQARRARQREAADFKRREALRRRDGSVA
ncbi:hypothetical protein MKK75_03010 [Methylobacterium sp. J-030]|uniref:hypothetical protein n=1 Tax=Methylobacterium sp. J-030 TaxID=2836627 RepID=UPI001FB8642C|nr:hypothetical protein [Methylobacterium sp. J-030]MCJ2067785.1 hypothetical protein [Methylobacterium sp. J-030]